MYLDGFRQTSAEAAAAVAMLMPVAAAAASHRRTSVHACSQHISYTPAVLLPPVAAGPDTAIALHAVVAGAFHRRHHD
jgi:hypothetical protein